MAAISRSLEGSLAEGPGETRSCGQSYKEETKSVLEDGNTPPYVAIRGHIKGRLLSPAQKKRGSGPSTKAAISFLKMA